MHGEAARILPLISALAFGFAVYPLLLTDSSMHPALLLTLGLSACLSLWTTVFCVSGLKLKALWLAQATAR